MNTPTLLQKVRAKMQPIEGAALHQLADQAGISYDTALRIRAGKSDPKFGHVIKLAELLKLIKPQPQPVTAEADTQPPAL